MQKPSSDKITTLLKKVLTGNVRVVSQVLTRIENRNPTVIPLLKALYPHTGGATLLGITGPAGAGKSTLINRLIRAYRKKNCSIGVLAIDPSSPFSGGALLGDRVRMHEHFLDPEVYIRSLAAPEAWGGISPALFDAIHVLDAMGKDLILIETIGVGQNEVRIAGLADILVLVLSPGLGDEIQTLKAGLLEVGDVLILSKCDQYKTEALQNQLHEIAPERPVIGISATDEDGMRKLMQHLEQCGQEPNRERKEAFSRSELQSLFYENLQLKAQNQHFSKEAIQNIVERKENPYDVLKKLMNLGTTLDETE